MNAEQAAREMMAMPGIDAMRALVEGRYPPPSISVTLGFRLVEVGDGFVAFEGEPSDAVLNPMGIVHGGWALTLIDSACGAAGHTTLPAGVGYGSLETKGNFVRQITGSTGRLRAEGRVLARGRTILTAEAKITDAGGKLYAHGTSTCMIIYPEGRNT
ncbi:MAG: PaaI family thioesterase [Hyphomonadaceae bacterium]|nr:PaaI family thioesterase [Hyphomonadaceae bacterium]